RHLRGFIDEKNVDAARGIRSSPEPRRITPNVRICAQSSQECSIVCREPQIRQVIFLFRNALDAPDALLIRSRNNLIEKVTDYFMTVGGNSHGFALAGESANHPSA